MILAQSGVTDLARILFYSVISLNFSYTGIKLLLKETYGPALSPKAHAQSQ